MIKNYRSSKRERRKCDGKKIFKEMERENYNMGFEPWFIKSDS
jgi:hypothetical protein